MNEPDYIHPSREELYPKLSVEFSEQEKSQDEGGTSPLPVSNLKLNVKRKSLPEVSFGSSRKSSLLPLSVKFNILLGGDMMEGIPPTPENDSEDVYYTRYGGSLLIPIQLYTTAGNDVIVTPFNIYGNKKINSNRTLYFNISDGCNNSEVLGDIKYVEINPEKPNGKYILKDDDRFVVEMERVAAKPSFSREGDPEKAVVRVFISGNKPTSGSYNIPIKISGTSTAIFSDYSISNLSQSRNVVLNSANNYSVDLEITASEDPYIEKDETLNLSLGDIAPFEITLSKNKRSATITIKDSNKPVTLSLEGSFSISENPANSDAKILLTTNEINRTEEDIIIPVAYANSTATISDFKNLYRDGTLLNPKAFPASFVIHPGKNSGELEFKTEDDDIFEGNELLKLNIADVQKNGRTFTLKSAKKEKDLIILDNDIPKSKMEFIPNITTVSMSNSSEAITTTTKLRISIGKPNSKGLGITGKVGISGTATLNSDYQLQGITIDPSNTSEGTVVISNGESFVDVTITRINDDLFEAPRETVDFEIKDFSDNIGIPEQNNKEFVILDDEKPVITVTKTEDGKESNTGASNTAKQVKFLITSNLVNNTGNPLSFNVDYSGTAIKDKDFFGPTTIDIKPGEENVSLNLEVIDDNLLENPETVIVKLSPSREVSASSTLTSTAEITDNDLFKVFMNSVQGEEGGNKVIYNLSIDKVNETGGPITIPLSFEGTATQEDFITTFPKTVTIANKSSSASPIELEVKDDPLTEGLEKIKIVALSKDPITNIEVPFMNNSAGPYSKEANVQDNDSFSLTVEKLSDGEEEGRKPVKFKFVLSQNNNTGKDINVDFSLIYVTSDIIDFENPPNQVTIESGKKEAILSLNVVDDALLERRKEEVGVKVTNVSYPNVTLPPNNSSGFIIDNDVAVLSVTSLGDVTEGSSRHLDFKVALDKVNRTGSSIILQKSFINKTLSGWVNSNDFNSATELDDGEIEIPNRSKEAIISMEVKDDAILEADEQVGLKVSIPTPSTAEMIYSRIKGDNNTKIASAKAKIIDNEKINLDDITSSSLNVNEGSPVTVTFHISSINNTGSDIVFIPSYSGLATSQDFATPLPTKIVFPVGKDEATYKLTPKLDNKIEPDEDLKISILPKDNPSVLSPEEISVEIIEKDIADLDITATSGEEGVTPVTFKVSLKNGTINDLGEDISLFLRLNSSNTGSASIADFVNIPTDIIIPNGENSVTVTLDALNDKLLENTENVSIIIERSSNKNINEALGSSGKEVTTTLKENSQDTTLNIETRDRVDGGVPLIIKYVLSGNKINDLGSPIVITPKFSGTYNQSDFLTPFPQTIEIPVGASSAEVVLNVKQYDTPEPEKTLNVGIETIMVATNTSNIIKGKTKSVVINGFTGDLPEVNLMIKKGTDGSETPNKNISFSISLENNKLATSPVSATLSYSGKATAEDFVDDLPSQVEIPVGKNSVTISIKVKEDFVFEEDQENLTVKIASVETPGFSVDFTNNQIELLVKDSKRVRPFKVFNNGISPNGDGVNDVFKIKNIEDMLNNELFIINRVGVTVYHQSNYDNTWGGIDSKGKRLPMGNYYYIFLYKKKYEIQGRIVYIGEKAKGSLFIK